MKKRRIMIAILIGTMAFFGMMTGCGTTASNTQSSAEAESGDSADSTQGKASFLMHLPDTFCRTSHIPCRGSLSWYQYQIRNLQIGRASCRERV